MTGHRRPLNVITNAGRSRPPRSTFHVDTSYAGCPPAYTALRAVQVPEQGGQTVFTNQYAAYRTLPARLRARVDGRTVTHVVTGLVLDAGAETSARHPLALRHPLSGQTALVSVDPAAMPGGQWDGAGGRGAVDRRAADPFDAPGQRLSASVAGPTMW